MGLCIESRNQKAKKSNIAAKMADKKEILSERLRTLERVFLLPLPKYSDTYFVIVEGKPKPKTVVNKANKNVINEYLPKMSGPNPRATIIDIAIPITNDERTFKKLNIMFLVAFMSGLAIFFYILFKDTIKIT